MSDTLGDLMRGKQKLTDDFRTLLSDIQEMLRLSGGMLGPTSEALRGRLQSRLNATQEALSAAQETAQTQYQAAARETDRYVRGNPWRAVGVGVALGVLIGALAAR